MFVQYSSLSLSVLSRVLVREPSFFMYHTTIRPSVFLQRMSAIPSALKSAVCSILQLALSVLSRVPVGVPLAFIVQRTIRPSVFLQRISAIPSALKSAACSILHLSLSVVSRVLVREPSFVHVPHNDTSIGISPKDIGDTISIKVSCLFDTPTCHFLYSVGYLFVNHLYSYTTQQYVHLYFSKGYRRYHQH